MKSSGMAWKATLQASQSSSKFFGLVLQASSFILPQICSIILISGDCAGRWNLRYDPWGMTPLVVGNVLGGKNLLIFGTINVTIHLTDLPGTSVLDVTPNHNLSTFKFDCVLGELWIQTGPWGSSTILAVLELNWLKNQIFCCPIFWLWALGYATRFLSSLLFSAGFWAAIRPRRPLRARIRCTVLLRNRHRWRSLLLELWGGPASCHLEQLSYAGLPDLVCHGHRQSLGSTGKSSPPAV